MTKLEYKVAEIFRRNETLEECLNRFGSQGWQLCVYSGGTCIFVRELDEELGAGERAYQERELPTL